MKESYDFTNAVVGKYAGKVIHDSRVTNRAHMKASTKWTNKSVRLLASGGDPIEIVRIKARELVLQALDKGGLTLPIDPFKLAESQSIKIVASPDVKDARTIAGPGGRPLIEYNPARPRARVRFSICHEIAHTLFPDCLEQVRNRGFHTRQSSDDHELEMLCNLAAAELLLPLGIFEDDLSQGALSIDMALELRQKYEASTEAVLWRLVGLSASECGVFAAVAEDASDLRKVRYRVEYVKTTQSWDPGIKRGDHLPAATIAAQCTAIGSTAKGEEVWGSTRKALRVEVVGTAPYPGDQVLPRVVGLIMPAGSHAMASRTPYELLRGDALTPRGEGRKIVAHVVNDATANWGAGFGRAVQTKWPQAQKHFKETFETARGKRLGLTAVSRVSDDVHTFQMVCQKGYGPSPSTRLRYDALRTCLVQLRETAKHYHATVHMPKIGTGEAGGSWELVSNLIAEELCSEGIPVTVYEPPNKTISRKAQESLFN